MNPSPFGRGWPRSGRVRALTPSLSRREREQRKGLHMAYLLNAFYLAAILLALPWLLYQRVRHGKYRDGCSAKFFGSVPLRTGDRPCLWLHAVSVGEVNVLEPILKRWERLHPDWECVISTTTQTGYQLTLTNHGP